MQYNAEINPKPRNLKAEGIQVEIRGVDPVTGPDGNYESVPWAWRQLRCWTGTERMLCTPMSL